MNMREMMARAMHDRFEADMHQASGGITPMRPWERNKKTHALYLAQADAALDALISAPKEIIDRGHDGDPYDSWHQIIRAIKEGA